MRPLGLDIVVRPRVDRERFTGGILAMCFRVCPGTGRDRPLCVRVVPATPSPRAQWFTGTATVRLLRVPFHRAGCGSARRCHRRCRRHDGDNVRHSTAGGTQRQRPEGLLHAALRAVLHRRRGRCRSVFHRRCAVALREAGHDARRELVVASVHESTEHTGRADVELCPNGIRLEHFHPPATDRPSRTAGGNRCVTVISYGGRNAEWKGFREMVHAVARVRRERPGGVAALAGVPEGAP